MGRSSLAGWGFTVLSIAFAATAIGVFRRRKWGWRLAVVFIGINALVAGVHLVLDLTVANFIGPVAAGVIFWWLARQKVRNIFSR